LSLRLFAHIRAAAAPVRYRQRMAARACRVMHRHTAFVLVDRNDLSAEADEVTNLALKRVGDHVMPPAGWNIVVSNA
jgi:hypothetical protein